MLERPGKSSRRYIIVCSTSVLRYSATSCSKRFCALVGGATTDFDNPPYYSACLVHAVTIMNKKTDPKLMQLA
jgi:hypothetical protein